jgi:glycosyltransferase involved in cell wall biosynthesis
MKSRGLDESKFHWIPNGISLPEVENNEPLDPMVLDQIPRNKFIIGYTGTLGSANAMNYLIDAAEILSGNDALHFVLVGEERMKEHLKKLLIKKIEKCHFYFINT